MICPSDRDRADTWDPETAAKNLYAWAELTDLCLQLRRAVLREFVPEHLIEEKLFADIRAFKERQWVLRKEQERVDSDLISCLIDLIRERLPDVAAVYRFGSAGTPGEHRGSDIDLAVLPARPLDPVPRWQLAQELATLAHRDIDLVDLLSASTVMRAQVIARGERLFCADERACATFEDYAFSAYARLNEERREILKDIVERGSVYGG
jgi:predicted nucleotidyltransferase